MEHLEEVEKFFKSNPLEMAIYYIYSIVDYQSENHFMFSYINYLNRGFILYFFF